MAHSAFASTLGGVKMGKWISMRVTTKRNHLRVSKPHRSQKTYGHDRHGAQIIMLPRRPNSAIINLNEQRALRQHEHATITESGRKLWQVTKVAEPHRPTRRPPGGYAHDKYGKEIVTVVRQGNRAYPVGPLYKEPIPFPSTYKK